MRRVSLLELHQLFYVLLYLLKQGHVETLIPANVDEHFDAAIELQQ